MKNLKDAFTKYEEKNPHVYEAFKKNALELAKAGVRKTSAWLIINKMRWDSMVSVNTELDYKIPNDFIGIYARRFMSEHPEYGSLFSVKSTKQNLQDLV